MRFSVVGWALGVLVGLTAGQTGRVMEAWGGDRGENVITRENALPGSRDWQLTRVQLRPGNTVRANFIEGYCSRQSVRAGEAIEFFVSTSPAARFQIEIFRTGYYGEIGRAHV